MIAAFTGKHRFLSNFKACNIFYDGYYYNSVEHGFQASKTLDHEQRIWVANSSSANIAKSRGQVVTLRPGWDAIKIPIMQDLPFKKFGTYRVVPENGSSAP